MENILKEVGPFRLTKKDINAYIWDWLIKKNQYYKYLSFSIAIGFGVGITSGYISHSWLNGLALFIWSFIAVLIFNIVKILRLSSLPQNKEIIKHDCLIQLCKKMVIGIQNSNISGYSWNNVISINQTRNHIFIYLIKNSAFIIPKTAFKNEKELLEFLETAFELIETNQSDS